jgi:2-dehydro-3-deoxygluconokinase
MSRVTAIGECLMELTRLTDRTLRLNYAGDTFNTAAYMSRLLRSTTNSVHYVTATGDDWYSDALVDEVIAEQLEPHILRVRGGTPAIYLVDVDAGGERSFTYHRATSPASHMFDGDWPVAFDRAVVESSLVYFSAITLQILEDRARRHLHEILMCARSKGALIAFDSNYRARGWPSSDAARRQIDSFLPILDIALPSMDDERQLAGDTDASVVARRYRAAGVKTVVVTDGPGPVTLADDDRVQTIDPLPHVNAVDTTGAGDSFNAGFLAATLLGCTKPDAVRLGQQLAGRVVQHRGALIPEAHIDNVLLREQLQRTTALGTKVRNP